MKNIELPKKNNFLDSMDKNVDIEKQLIEHFNIFHIQAI